MIVKWIIESLRSSYRNYTSRRELVKLFPTLRLGKQINIFGPLCNMKIGRNNIFRSNVIIDLGGIDWCKGQGKLEIGDNACLSSFVVIYAAGPGGVRIGNNFDCGPGVKIFSSRTDYKESNEHIFAPVIIGDNVIIYANAVISPGVTIGDGAVIAAGSVVTTNIPSNSMVGGIPAKVIKFL